MNLYQNGFDFMKRYQEIKLGLTDFQMVEHCANASVPAEFFNLDPSLAQPGRVTFLNRRHKKEAWDKAACDALAQCIRQSADEGEWDRFAIEMENHAAIEKRVHDKCAQPPPAISPPAAISTPAAAAAVPAFPTSMTAAGSVSASDSVPLFSYNAAENILPLAMPILPLAMPILPLAMRIPTATASCDADHELAAWLHAELNGEENTASTFEGGVLSSSAAGATVAPASATVAPPVTPDRFLISLKELKRQPPDGLSEAELKGWRSRQRAIKQTPLHLFASKLPSLLDHNGTNHLARSLDTLQQRQHTAAENAKRRHADDSAKKAKKAKKQQEHIEKETTKVALKCAKKALSKSNRTRTTKKKQTAAQRASIINQDFSGSYFYDSDDERLMKATNWWMGDQHCNRNGTMIPGRSNPIQGQTIWVDLQVESGEGKWASHEPYVHSYVWPRVQEYITATEDGEPEKAKQFGLEEVARTGDHGIARQVKDVDVKLPVQGSYDPDYGGVTKSTSFRCVGDDAEGEFSPHSPRANLQQEGNFQFNPRPYELRKRKEAKETRASAK